MLRLCALLIALVALPPCLALTPVEQAADLSVGAPWKVCEALPPSACDADRCATCTRLDGKALCFTPETATKLPSFAFHCVMPGAAGTNGAEAKPTPPAPWQVCEALSASECGDASDRCSLCSILDGKQLCFEPEIAAKMPPFIFKCTGPDPAPPALEAKAAPAAGKPAPKVICEMLGPKECEAESDVCSLCTRLDGKKQLCFRPDVAAGMSPWAFKCSGAQPKPKTVQAAASAGRRAGPTDAAKSACESLTPVQCATQAGCTSCTRIDGWELCFQSELAAKLSSYAYQCRKPSAAAAAGNLAKPEPSSSSSAAKPAKPWTPCEAYKGAACTDAPGCVLCTKLSGKAICFHEHIAAKLPSAIFSCTEPKAADNAATGAEEAESKPKPEPAPAGWVPCEASHASECDDSTCSLCTLASGEKLCFNPKVAARLPEPFFKCTEPEAGKV